MIDLKYKRVLLKFSGEALSGNKGFGIDQDTLNAVTEEIISVKKLGVQIGIVIGGGNIFRGLSASEQGMDRVRADYMGMLATVINALAVQDALIGKGMKTKLFSAVQMNDIAEPMVIRNAIDYLENENIVIFSAGTGRPFFSTDSGAALRAVEIKADLLIKATKVEGVYDKDPVKFEDAIKFDELDFKTAIDKELKVMDITAFTLCKDNNLPIIVCNMTKSGNLKKILSGEKIGTIVSWRKNDQ